MGMKMGMFINLKTTGSWSFPFFFFFPLFFLCRRRLVFDIFFIRCASMDEILGVYSTTSSSDNTSEYRIR